MKPIRTPEANVTLTLADDDGNRIPDGDLPACRALLVDHSRGQTKEDATIGYITVWQPDDREARQLEAGACVQVTIWGKQHPPVAVGVTDAVVPERELIDRSHVDRAMGAMYGKLRDVAGAETLYIASLGETGEPNQARQVDPGTFVDLWIEAVDETRPREAGGPGPEPTSNGQPTA